jgi:gliding motility-associated-like protein
MIPVNFSPPPVANISGQNVCLNVSTQFTDLSNSSPGDPINSWSWAFGDGGTSASQNPSHTYQNPGSYTVTLIVTTILGCKDTISQPVTVYNPPLANFSQPDSGCSPVCTSFNDLSTSIDGTVTSWLWSFPGGSPATSTSSAPSSCWYTPGNYDVQLIVTTNFGCKDTLLIPQYINVYPWPAAQFCVTPSQAPVTNPVFTFCDLWSSDVISWVWDFGDGSALDSTNTDPVHSYSAIATNNDFYSFNVCVYVQNQYGCRDTICQLVELIPEFTFYIPNAFTPNEDGFNEVFFGKSRGVKEYNIWIFDRWGNLIWACDYKGKNIAWDNTGQDGMSSACKWNGKVEGGNSDEIVQQDVYVWKVKLTDIFDKKHTYIGHVSVVK